MGPVHPSDDPAAGLYPGLRMSPIHAQPIDPRWVELVGELAPRVLGRADRTGSALAAQVAHLSELYTRERHAIERAGEDIAARLRFFFLRDLPKIEGPLAELAAAGALPRGDRWRVLDVGAGLGTSFLGAAAFARRAGASGLDVTVLERDAGALDVMARLAERAAELGLIAPVRIDARRVDLESIELAGLPPADLVLVGLTLNELFADRDEADRRDAREAALRALASRLAEGGSLVVIEPATRELTRELMHLRDRFAEDPGPPHVFAPCLRDAPCPLLSRERDWCHDQLAFVLPEPLAAIASEAGLRWERLTYAYLTLRTDERRLWDLAALDPHAYRVVGGPVESKGKTEWDCCGARALVRLRRVDRERSEANAALDGAARGTLLRFESESSALRARPDVPIERLFR